MKYIESQKIKNENIQSGEISSMAPWTISDGTFQKLLDENFTRTQNDLILDIGCGSGATLKTAQPYFKKLFGIDLALYLNDDIKQLVNFSQVDLNFEPLPYTDSSIDLITAFQVVEHLENPFYVMREIHRTLKKDGFFVMSVPNPYQITFRVKFLFTSNMPPWTEENNHLLFLTKDVLKKTYLDKFELIDTIYQKGAVPFWGRLRMIFGKKLIKKHAMVLPRSEMFGRRVCYVLKKK